MPPVSIPCLHGLNNCQPAHVASQTQIKKHAPFGTIAAQFIKLFFALLTSHGFHPSAVFNLNLPPPMLGVFAQPEHKDEWG